MSARLDQERQHRLEPERIRYVQAELEKRGYKIIEETATTLVFVHAGHPVRVFLYSGWFTGKTVQDGRGCRKLFEQLDRKP